MTKLTYEQSGQKRVKVLIDGVFAGWLERETRRTTGLDSKRVAYWTGRVQGRDVTAPTVAAAKAKIAKYFQ